MSEKNTLSSFLSFLRGSRTAIVLAVLLALGAFLILPLGGGSEGETEASDEERLAALCSSIEGVGECRVYITYTTETRGSTRVESVAVVCRGASSPSVQAELTSLISSLFGIGTNRISISKMKG